MTQLIRGLAKIRQHHRGGAISIGKFDAMHRGHQQLFKDIKRFAKQHQCPSILISLDPYPQDYFSDRYQPRLTNIVDKLRILAEFDIDYLLILPFNAYLEKLSARRFIEEILIETLAIRKLWLGDDFRFGNNRQGDFALLSTYAANNHFHLQRIQPFIIDAQKASSSTIRKLISAGQFAQAEILKWIPFLYQRSHH